MLTAAEVVIVLNFFLTCLHNFENYEQMEQMVVEFVQNHSTERAVFLYRVRDQFKAFIFQITGLDDPEISDMTPYQMSAICDCLYYFTDTIEEEPDLVHPNFYRVLYTYPAYRPFILAVQLAVLEAINGCEVELQVDLVWDIVFQ